MRRFIKLAGIFNLIYAILFLIYWLLYGVFLPFKEIESSILPLVSDPDWVWINSIGAFSPLFGLIGVTGLYYLQVNKNKFLGILGFILTIFGLAFGTAQLFWETYIWKIISETSPDLLDYSGPLYSNTVLFGVMVTGGIIFSLGYFFLGIASRTIDTIPSFGLQMIILGAPLFGLAPLFGPIQQLIRIIGILGFSAGLIVVGIWMIHIKSD